MANTAQLMPHDLPRFCRLIARGLSLVAAMLTAACSPLALVNGLVPTDGLAITRAAAYGPAERLREAGGMAEEAHYQGIGHYAIPLALARPSRGLAPVLDDAAHFIRAH
jgi:hypothetical protein